MAQLAAEAEGLERSLVNLSGGSRQAANYIDAIKDASRGTIAEMDAMQMAITAQTLGVVESSDQMRQLTEVANELGASTAQLALAWLLRLPEVSSVITGASRVSQVHENLKAAELKHKLTPEVLERIEATLDNDPNSQG